MDGRALAALPTLNQDALLLKQLKSSNTLLRGLKASLDSHCGSGLLRKHYTRIDCRCCLKGF